MNTTTNDIGGQVTGSVVQASQITLHQHLPAQPYRPPIPAQLPRPPARRVVDRDAERATLTGLLSGVDGATVIVVSGPAGIGKSTLVLHWAHRHRQRFPDGQLHVDFTAEPELTTTAVLERLLRAVGVAAPAVPSSLVERVHLWRSTTRDRRLLLVVEGVRRAEQVRDLLPATEHCLTVVISRSPLDDLAVHGAHQLPLPPLPQPAVVDLLTTYAGTSRATRERTHLERLATASGGHPLTAALLGAHLATRPHLPVGELANLYSTHRRDRPERWIGAMTLAHHALGDPARTLWTILRGSPCHDLDREAIGVLLPGLDAAGCDAAVTELVAADLLHRDGSPEDPRYRVPDALRGERTADPEVTAALERLVEHYADRLTDASETLEPGKFAFSGPPTAATSRLPDRAAARTWFEVERVNVMACQQLAADLGRDDLVWRIGERLWIPLRSAGLFSAVLDSQVLAAGAARRLAHPYVSAAYSRTCWALTRLGRHDEAVQASEQALALAVTFDHAWSRSTAWSQLGRAYHASGAPQLALHCLRRAEAEDTSPVAKGLRRRHMGEVHRSTGDLAAAETDFRTALDLIRSSPRPRPPETARALTMLAEVLVDRNRPRQAVDELRDAVALLDPDADALYLAEVEFQLGRALHACGDHDGAQPHWLRAAALFDRAGHPQRAAEARAHHDAGTESESG